MKITTRSEYGLRAMYYLKQNYEDNPIPIAKMVEELCLSQNYLEQLFRSLKKDNLVISYRGKDGGYRLAKDPKDITIGSIIRSLEGDIELASKCNISHSCISIDCITRNIFYKIDSAVSDVIDNLTLQDI